MTAPIPPHGTPARYRGNSAVEPCRCDPCTKVTSRLALQCAVERLAGNPRRLPIEPIWQHVLQLRAGGLNDAEIARAAGLARRGAITKLGKQKTVGRDIARAVLAVPLNHWEKDDAMPAIGATRRLQALMVRGHSGSTIAAHADTEHWRIFKLTSGLQERISCGLDEAIRRTYTQLCNEPGTSSKAATIAARHGWHGPDAWDDIDDPAEDPAAELHLSAREQAKERQADIVLLASAGNTPEQIAARTGFTKGYVCERLRADRPALYLELTA